jgi:hypothetical protein
VKQHKLMKLCSYLKLFKTSNLIRKGTKHILSIYSTVTIGMAPNHFVLHMSAGCSTCQMCHQLRAITYFPVFLRHTALQDIKDA